MTPQQHRRLSLGYAVGASMLAMVGYVPHSENGIGAAIGSVAITGLVVLAWVAYSKVARCTKENQK